MDARAMRLMVLISIALISSSCADKKMRIISPEIPLTMYDLEEVRRGADRHKSVLKNYSFIENDAIQQYLNEIGHKLSQVSERPHLPWQFYIFDEDENVEAYALPGGYIYMSSGLFRFIESEAELAAIIAHEVGHTSAFRYQEVKPSKKVKLFKIARLGAGAAGGLLGGPAGSIAGSALQGVEVSSPFLKQQFSKDAEVEADGRAMGYLHEVGYPTEAMVRINARLSRISIDSLPRFVHFFSAHPPSEFRVQEASDNQSKNYTSKDSVAEPTDAAWGVGRHQHMIELLNSHTSYGEDEKIEEEKGLLQKILDKATGSVSTSQTPPQPAEISEVIH